ncbi:homeobox protein cut-like 1 [Lagenorhynchus albirostris]|uniref:homeobox protein cut-like 1 n=1 Tax=Lagenorhynchus albirostris TaxID=27610 RepID=UPI0028ED850D|nr:homeobox protein cut-like 1 [Lagenorhynchus albirostris]
MPSGDVRDDRGKSRPQPRRALWQAGQPPRAPRLGVGGPAPGVGGAGATSGPDVSPQPHPGGAGYRRRRRQRRAAHAEGAGIPERASAGWSGHAPTPGEEAWPRTRADAIGPQAPPPRRSATGLGHHHRG